MNISVDFLIWMIDNHPEDLLEAHREGGRELFEEHFAEFIEHRDKEG